MMKKVKRSGGGKAQQAMREAKPEGGLVTLENANSRLSNFIKYYKAINLMPDDEWDTFFSTNLTAPPVAFRFTKQHRLCNNILDGKPGMESQTSVLRDYMKKNVLPKLAKKEINGQQVEVKCLQWYPDELAYQINFNALELRQFSVLRDLSDWLISETVGFNVLRQEVSTMLPPVLLDIQPHHKVLDMCTAPGWKAAQITEAIYSDTDNLYPEGFLVANDIESNRMQWRWTQGTNCMFMKHDARYLPDLFMGKEQSEENKLYYDRILCDVPCSQDGTFRKNNMIRGQWAASTAMNNHKTQKKLLQRGLELLTVGGRLLYCTMSMNPVENEAVVLAMLMQAPNSLELVDVSDKVPDFKYNGGMSSWKVMGTSGVFYDTIEDSTEWFKKTYEDTLFPPAPEVVSAFHMERCLRVLPHHNNTGGFFCAVIEKTGELPWAVAAKIPATVKPTTEAAEGDDKEKTKTPEKAKPEGEPSEKKPRYQGKPLKIITNVGVTMMEWETTTTDEQGDVTTTTERQEFDVPAIKVAADRKYGSYPAKKEDKEKKEQDEDLYRFLQPDNETWLKVKEFYQISDDLDPSLMNLRVQETVWYFTTPVLKNLMLSNKDRPNVRMMKNFGLKCFVKHANPLTPDCDMVLSVQGILAIFPYIGARKVMMTRSDMLLVLANKNVAFEKLSEQAQADLQSITPGCVVLHFTPTSSEPEPNTDILFVGWRDQTWVSDHVGGKYDTAHYARLFGHELQDLKKEVDPGNVVKVKVELGEGDDDAEITEEADVTGDMEEDDSLLED